MSVEIAPIEGLPEIRSGDSLGELIAAGAQIVDGDVVVISQTSLRPSSARIPRSSS